MSKNLLLLLIIGILISNSTYAGNTDNFDVEVNITTLHNNITLIFPPNGLIYNGGITSAIINFQYNATNYYNETQNFLIYIDNTLVGITNDYNFTTTVTGPGYHNWYIIANSTLAWTQSETYTFKFSQDFEDTGITCNPGDTREICQTIGSIGAGFGIFIQYIFKPLAYLLISIILIEIIYIIGMAIAERLEDENGLNP